MEEDQHEQDAQDSEAGRASDRTGGAAHHCTTTLPVTPALLRSRDHGEAETQLKGSARGRPPAVDEQH